MIGKRLERLLPAFTSLTNEREALVLGPAPLAIVTNRCGAGEGPTDHLATLTYRSEGVIGLGLA